jgi:hypothetical protein
MQDKSTLEIYQQRLKEPDNLVQPISVEVKLPSGFVLVVLDGVDGPMKEKILSGCRVEIYKRLFQMEKESDEKSNG